MRVQKKEERASGLASATNGLVNPALLRCCLLPTSLILNGVDKFWWLHVTYLIKITSSTGEVERRQQRLGAVSFPLFWERAG